MVILAQILKVSRESNLTKIAKPNWVRIIGIKSDIIIFSLIQI